jgi:phage gpG-like protein
MGDTFEVTATGFRELVAAITAIEEEVKGPGLNRLAEQVGSALLNRIRTRFLAETDPDGVEWEPSIAGQIRKAGGKTYRDGKGYSGTGTLFETGALFHSIQLGEASGGEINIGTDIPYASRLQKGEDGLPARVFLGFGGDDVQFAEDVIHQRIEEILRGKT